jgi:hypothetical protein
MSGLPSFSVEVQARVARVSCGIRLDKYWAPKKYSRRDKFWSDDRQCWMAKDQMQWLLKAVCVAIFSHYHSME